MVLQTSILMYLRIYPYVLEIAFPVTHLKGIGTVAGWSHHRRDRQPDVQVRVPVPRWSASPGMLWGVAVTEECHHIV